MTNKLTRIMYIEDEPDITTIAKIALEEIGGFTLKCCHSGLDALKESVEFNPDLFLIDVMMPHIDGPTTLQELRKLPQFVTTPIIFLTAKSQPSEHNKFIELGAIGVIEKPFDPIQLADTIRGIWKYANHK